jgi:hypothetical protein
MRKAIRAGLILSIFIVLIFSGCGDDFHHHLGPATGNVELNNYSDATIDGFYLVLVSEPSWGPNILPDLIYPGGSRLFTGIAADYYDAKIRSTGLYSDYFAYQFDIPIDSRDTFALNVFNSSFSGSLEIRNNTSGANIIGVYVVPADASTWGVNQVSSIIGPSGVLHLTDFNPGLYDVKVVWSAGPDSIYYNNSIESLTLTTLTVD